MRSAAERCSFRSSAVRSRRCRRRRPSTHSSPAARWMRSLFPSSFPRGRSFVAFRRCRTRRRFATPSTGSANGPVRSVQSTRFAAMPTVPCRATSLMASASCADYSPAAATPRGGLRSSSVQAAPGPPSPQHSSSACAPWRRGPKSARSDPWIRPGSTSSSTPCHCACARAIHFHSILPRSRPRPSSPTSSSWSRL